MFCLAHIIGDIISLSAATYDLNAMLDLGSNFCDIFTMNAYGKSITKKEKGSEKDQRINVEEEPFRLEAVARIKARAEHLGIHLGYYYPSRSQLRGQARRLDVSHHGEGTASDRSCDA